MAHDPVVQETEYGGPKDVFLTRTTTPTEYGLMVVTRFKTTEAQRQKLRAALGIDMVFDPPLVFDAK